MLVPIWQVLFNGIQFDTHSNAIMTNQIFKAMQKGNISVQTENIFPIIKKFLYSDHEIFLRELISNAVDATTKLRALVSRGEVKGDIGDDFDLLRLEDFPRHDRTKPKRPELDRYHWW